MSTTFNLTLSQLVRSVLRKCGVLAKGEDPAADDFTAVVQALNLTLKGFQSDGIYRWAIEEASFATVDGQARYVLPVDTLEVSQVRLRDANGDDYSIPMTDRYEWAAIPDRGRLQESWLPTMCHFDPTVVTVGASTGPTLTFYEIPDAATYTIYYWKIRKLADLVNLTDTPDVHQRWLDALIYGAAARYADEIPLELPRCQWLQQKADFYLRMARGGNSEPTDQRFFDPAY